MQVVFRLKRKKILAALKNGVYVFSPLESGPQGVGVDELLIPPVFFPKQNYYVGYSTMFNYYGFTEQLFQTVYVLNTMRTRSKIIGGISFQFLKVCEDRMYGVEIIKVKNADVRVSSKERTLIDALYFNGPLGGIDAAIDVFKRFAIEKKCDIKKLVEYAALFPNVTTRKRAGVILEELGTEDKALKPLLASIKDTSISSLTGSRKGTLNKKWRVIVDASQK
jgi:predicted transcriptional regulator of viral defense system